ncbi:MAG TPA: ABC transporter substrate-binding protein, partial [Candidatus Methylomirabilis sp.]|nr:ABC transporter substrate-binding protein [Candidatus Methylomirabilis sp.]
RGAAVHGILLIVALLTAPAPSLGQQPAKVYRIGWLSSFRSEATPRDCPRKGTPFWQAWVKELRGHGYVLGRNLLIECRYTEGRQERAPALAAELVDLKVDLLIAGNTSQVRAAKQATSTIPIVMYGVIDPVRRGLVASLARPGGNVTGLADDAGVEILGKYLEFLTEAVPKVSRVAALWHLNNFHDPPEPAWSKVIEAEARALGVTVQTYGVRDPEELEGAFGEMTKARAEALLVVPHPFFDLHAQRIVDLAAQRRLPAMYADRPSAEGGGLMAYAVNNSDTPRRLGVYVDRILKGARPGDLPVEQPTNFELIINLKTAKALGLTIPPTLLIQADELID